MLQQEQLLFKPLDLLVQVSQIRCIVTAIYGCGVLATKDAPPDPCITIGGAHFAADATLPERSAKSSSFFILVRAKGDQNVLDDFSAIAELDTALREQPGWQDRCWLGWHSCCA